MKGAHRPVADIVVDLGALGVKPGDLLMVHASLRAIGPVEGGADGVIDAIREALGSSGTMLMVLGAHDGWAWVNERPEAERPALLADAEPFDASTTPADPEAGTLAEVFRQRPETQVSDHPEGRFAAAGPLAHELLDDVPWDDYFGPGSPLERLIWADGRVLRLGPDPNTMTVLHHAEYLASVSPKRRVRRYRLVVAPGGAEVRVVDTLDDDEGIVDYEGDDYFEDILRGYLEEERARLGRVGEARSELIEARDIVEYGVRWMDTHLVGKDPDAVEPRRSRLRADHDAARRQGRRREAAALGSVLTAIANAEAVPVVEGPYQLVEGSADVPRRALTEIEVEAIVAAEIDERRTAIDQYERLGADTSAVREELAALERHRQGSG